MTLSRHRLFKIPKTKMRKYKTRECSREDQNETVQNSENENMEVQNEGEVEKDQNEA